MAIWEEWALVTRVRVTTSCFSPDMTSVIGPEEEKNCRSTVFLEWVFKVGGGML